MSAPCTYSIYLCHHRHDSILVLFTLLKTCPWIKPSGCCYLALSSLQATANLKSFTCIVGVSHQPFFRVWVDIASCFAMSLEHKHRKKKFLFAPFLRGASSPWAKILFLNPKRSPQGLSWLYLVQHSWPSFFLLKGFSFVSVQQFGAPGWRSRGKLERPHGVC